MAKAADRVPLLFLSTQLRPIAEAQKMRNVILKDFLHEVEFVTTTSQQAATLINQQMMGSTHAADVVGALHGIGFCCGPLRGIFRQCGFHQSQGVDRRSLGHGGC